MNAENTAEAPAQECGLIVQQEGKPQQVLAKFLNLMLNYQYGLSALMAQNLPRASSLLQRNTGSVRCAFLIQNQESRDKPVITALGKQGSIPLFMVVPQARLNAQQKVCQDLENVYYCSWERAFSHSDESLQYTANVGLDENGIGDLFQDIEKIPYPVVQQQVERRLKNINTLPTLPEIIMRIMRMVNDPKTTTDELEQVLCTDPAIVMKLLQVVKSPVFAGTVQRGSWSLNEIIVRLGLKKVGAIAQQIKLINSLVKPEESQFDLRGFWEHSVGCAMIADKLCSDNMLPLKSTIEFSDYWIGALLHDIGKLVLGFFFWDWFSRVLDRVQGAGISFRRAETGLGDSANHERLGRLLMMNANMGEELASAVGTHHASDKDPSELVCLLHIANNLCKDLGLGYLPEERGQYSKEVLETLGMTSSSVALLRSSLADNLTGEIKRMVEQCL